jgi:hypothetical protein
MVLTVYSALSLVIGLSCHHRRQLVFADLISASRYRDHAASPSAFGAFVSCTARVHRIPHHVRDDREAPLLRGTGRPKEMAVICPTEQAKYFWLNIWTESPDARQKFTDLPVGQIW